MKPKLKNYRVIKRIGQGGMGLVYVAEDLALGRLVALKVLAPYLVQDPEILERFRFEARNQAQLVHPHITMVYSFLEEEQQAFLVLEFIDGETLESRINREGRIAAVETVAIFRKILGAIGYAHSKGVIHRDIKPSNIAFTSEGNVKIMDFGIALNISETGRLTKTGHVLGTPHYMAPEQILGQEVTFRTDIYALGITLFEMLTGRLPFDSKSDFAVRMAQVSHPPPSPRSFGHPDITPELEEVILKALAKDPEERFANAGEFLEDLDAAVGQDHLATLVKGLRLDKSTHILKGRRKLVLPPVEPEREEPATPPPEPQIEELAEPPPVAPELEEQPAAPLAEAQESSGAAPLEEIEELPVAPLFELPPEEPALPRLEEQPEEPSSHPAAVPQMEESPPPLLSELQEVSVSPPLEQVEELAVSPLSEPPQEEPPAPPLEAQIEEPPAPPPVAPELEEQPAAPLAAARESSGAAPLEEVEELPVAPLFELSPEEPALPRLEEQPEEPSPPPAAASQMEESPPPLLSELQEVSVSPPLEQVEELAVSLLSEPPQEELSAPPLEAQLEEPPAAPAVAAELEEQPAAPLAEAQEFSGAAPLEEVEELPVAPPFELPPEEPPAPPLEEQLEEPPAPPAAVPEMEEQFAASLAEDQELSGSPPSGQVEELLVTPLSEAPPEEPSVTPPEAQKIEPPPSPSFQAEPKEPSAPAPAAPGLEAASVVPSPAESFPAVRGHSLPAFGEQPSQKLAAKPVLEESLVPTELQTRRSYKARLLIPLALLPFFVLFIFFRSYFLPNPQKTSNAGVSSQSGTMVAGKTAPPPQHREEKTQVAAVPPPVQAVIPVPQEVASTELAKIAKDQPEKEKPVTMAAVPPPEKKAEIVEVKRPNPVDLQKNIKEHLAANGFSNLGVRVEEVKKGGNDAVLEVVISGNVKNLAQKKKIVQIVSSLGLAVPADYSQLKVVRPVVETVKKKVEEKRPPILRPEAPPRPLPETPRKPLPPRLDRGNIQF